MKKLTRTQICEKVNSIEAQSTRYESELETAHELNDKVFLSTEREPWIIAEKRGIQIRTIANQIANLGVLITVLREFRSSLAETKEINEHSTLDYPDMPSTKDIDHALEITGDDLIELEECYNLFCVEFNRLTQPSPTYF